MNSVADRSRFRQYFRNLWWWGVPIFALAAMAGLYLSGANTALFIQMNHAMMAAGDPFWSHVTILGDSVIAIMFILPFLHRRPDVIWQFVLTVFVAGLTVYLMKDPDILRPPAVLDPGSFHLIGPFLKHVSFPSGHTTTAFLLAGLFCLRQANPWLKSLVLTLAIVAGLSRIACGVHWPVDVLGGAFVGWVSAAAGIWLSKRWTFGLNVRAQRSFALLFTFVAIWSPLYYNNAYPGTWLMQFIVTATCLFLSVPGQLKLFGLRR